MLSLIRSNRRSRRASIAVIKSSEKASMIEIPKVSLHTPCESCSNNTFGIQADISCVDCGLDMCATCDTMAHGPSGTCGFEGRHHHRKPLSGASILAQKKEAEQTDKTSCPLSSVDSDNESCDDCASVISTQSKSRKSHIRDTLISEASKQLAEELVERIPTKDEMKKAKKIHHVEKKIESGDKYEFFSKRRSSQAVQRRPRRMSAPAAVRSYSTSLLPSPSMIASMPTHLDQRIERIEKAGRSRRARRQKELDDTSSCAGDSVADSADLDELVAQQYSDTVVDYNLDSRAEENNNDVFIENKEDIDGVENEEEARLEAELDDIFSGTTKDFSYEVQQIPRAPPSSPVPNIPDHFFECLLDENTRNSANVQALRRTIRTKARNSIIETSDNEIGSPPLIIDENETITLTTPTTKILTRQERAKIIATRSAMKAETPFEPSETQENRYSRATLDELQVKREQLAGRMARLLAKAGVLPQGF
eukprot:m.344253 g.344253  ORF g.344253 m.344253 type:complete len:480 (-) comp24071_c0_seq1:212-1651(-)